MSSHEQIKLIFFTAKFQKIDHMPLHEWLLEKAKEIGIMHGVAIKSIAGFIAKGEMLEEHFFETGSDVPIEVHLMTESSKEKKFIEVIKDHKLEIYYTREVIKLFKT